MAGRRPSSDDDEFCYFAVVDGSGEKNYLKEFILLYESCPSLWNPKDKLYYNTSKKNEDLDKLLQIYKKIKPNASKDDVRKKINTLRSNFRREMRKIEISKQSHIAGGEVYEPTSSTFYLLQFLANVKSLKLKKLKKENGSSEANCGEENYLENDSSEVNSGEENCLEYYSSEPNCGEENTLGISYVKNEMQPTKLRKTSGTTPKQNKPSINRVCTILPQLPVSPQSVSPLALIWSDKLRDLHPTQKLFAEKAINDVLFEAQLNNLHRHSVQINMPFTTHSSPTTSTPYKPSPVSQVPDDVSENSEI